METKEINRKEAIDLLVETKALLIVNRIHRIKGISEIKDILRNGFTGYNECGNSYLQIELEDLIDDSVQWKIIE